MHMAIISNRALKTQRREKRRLISGLSLQLQKASWLLQRLFRQGLAIVHVVVALGFRDALSSLTWKSAHGSIDPRQSEGQPVAARHQVVVHVVLPQRCQLLGERHPRVADEMRKLVHEAAKRVNAHGGARCSPSR